ncbi:macro domain-containing protein [Microbulbifer sp. GL-2]|uniref:macro domain-containing protein n=1 Tax=Microbulbifer sp. GL-2 TaxID=2591606 RepID=UPI001164B104|nr:macro domain-containing protein [Microbulbifer sp. GL-2]BBM00172.1 Appr-1-p processing protein [Microbulbifer sp. GL-2]
MEGSYRKVSIHYVKGDATAPRTEGHAIITHICNDLGKWGRGFVLAISKRWKEPERQYKAWFTGNLRPQLGDVQFVTVTEALTVANIIGQHGVRSPRNKTAPAPVRYDSIREGLSLVADYAQEKSASIHMPRIGCGLAGGQWEEIEPIITGSVVSKGVEVFVYDLD